jgi:putative sterol carrier protein
MSSAGKTTLDPTTKFFDELGRREQEPMLRKLTSTLRIELVDGRKTERWFVSVRKGQVSVSRADAAAECVVRCDRALFDDMARGKTNALAALLRGDIGVQGNVELVALFQKLFPGPPNAVGPRRAAEPAGRKR